MINNEKIAIMMEKLSKERQNHVNGLIQGAIDKLTSKNVNQNITYTAELTERFDKEEPHQFIWISFNFSSSNLPFMIPTPMGGLVNAVQNLISITDMEVYSPSNIDEWLDHTSRIKEQKEKESKEDNSSNSKQENNMDNQINPNNNNEEEFDEEQAIIELEWLFSPLFSSPHTKENTPEEYMNIFSRYTSIFANRMMKNFINIEDKMLDSMYDNMNESLIMLTSEFDKCDFTKFSKEQLEQLGFVNWRNKTLMIPIWAYPIILKNNKGLILSDIKGEEWAVGRDYIFTDDKNGAMVVGIPFKKVKSEVFDSNIETYEIIVKYIK